RVGEDIAAADHRHAEDDRDRGQGGAELAAEEALEGDGGHLLPTSSIAAITWAALAPASSLTTTPSARKRTRSAIAAARGSCVTITVVCPYSSTASRTS